MGTLVGGGIGGARQDDQGLRVVGYLHGVDKRASVAQLVGRGAWRGQPPPRPLPWSV